MAKREYKLKFRIIQCEAPTEGAIENIIKEFPVKLLQKSAGEAEFEFSYSLDDSLNDEIINNLNPNTADIDRVKEQLKRESFVEDIEKKAGKLAAFIFSHFKGCRLEIYDKKFNYYDAVETGARFIGPYDSLKPSSIIGEENYEQDKKRKATLDDIKNAIEFRMEILAGLI